MSLTHICENMKMSLPSKLLDELMYKIQWEGHEAESWLAPRDVLVVEKWVRDMCESGCPAYDKTPHCPPNLPNLEEVKKKFEKYNAVLILRYSNFHAWKDRDKLENAESLSDLVVEDRAELKTRQELRLKMRTIANYLIGQGYEILPTSAGHCRLCEPPESCNEKKCKQPDISMPAVEGMGIHVFETMEKLGHHMQYPAPNPFSFYNAILINLPHIKS